MQLLIIRNAATVYMEDHEENEAPSIKTLVDEGYIRKEEGCCPLGYPYEFSSLDQAPSCTSLKWGHSVY